MFNFTCWTNKTLPWIFLSLSSVSTFAFYRSCNLKWSGINRKSNCWQFSKSEICIQFSFLSIAEKSRQKMHVYYRLNRSIVLDLSVLHPKDTVNGSYVKTQVCSPTLRILSHMASACSWKNTYLSCRNPGLYLSALCGHHSVCIALCLSTLELILKKIKYLCLGTLWICH